MLKFLDQELGKVFKVLIVDDEPLVVSLIEKIINWEEVNMTIVGTADNGLSALQMVEGLQPDIVIVDVNMPEYNGITLMRKVRELNNNVRFIVISGHKRFEYAKSAMKYNVEDYLLKPISKRELETILLKLKAELEFERKNELTMKKMDDRLGVITNQVRTNFMGKFIENSMDWETFNTEKINQTYYTHFMGKTYQCIIVKLDSREKNLDHTFLKELLSKIAKQIEKNLSQWCQEIIYIIEKFRIIFIINHDDQPNDLLNPIEHAKNTVDEDLLKFEKLILTIGIGNSVPKISMSYESFKTASKLIDARISLGVGTIILEKYLKEDPGIINIVLSDKQREEILNAVKNFEINKIKLQVLEVFYRSEEYRNSDSLLYMKIVYEITQIFYKYIRGIDIYKGSYQELYENLNHFLEECMTSREIADALINYISSFIKKYMENNQNDESPAVRIAKRYIMENYQNDISLSSISEVVNLSSVYFSILFKKEVGINFLDYLNQYRIDISKTLLKDVKNNINEVANLSGFQNARYYSKKFKKIVGITPTEYRNRHIEK